MFFNVWYTEKIYFALNAVLQTPSWHSFTGVSPIFLLSIGVATLVMLIHLRKTGTISNLQAVTSRVPTVLIIIIIIFRNVGRVMVLPRQ